MVCRVSGNINNFLALSAPLTGLPHEEKMLDPISLYYSCPKFGGALPLWREVYCILSIMCSCAVFSSCVGTRRLARWVAQLALWLTSHLLGRQQWLTAAVSAAFCVACSRSLFLLARRGVLSAAVRAHFSHFIVGFVGEQYVVSVWTVSLVNPVGGSIPLLDPTFRWWVSCCYAFLDTVRRLRWSNCTVQFVAHSLCSRQTQHFKAWTSV